MVVDNELICMGKGNPLVGAQLLMNYAHLGGYDQIQQLYDMITYNVAKVMQIEQYGIEVG